MLTSLDTQQDRQDVDLIWHKQVPLRASIFAWRLLRDRIPTKSNLMAQGVIDYEACLCVAGCSIVEDARHLFLACSCFGSIWPLLRSWIGFDGVDHNIISDHFTQFTYCKCVLKSRRSFLRLVWVLWTERNNRLFNQKEYSIVHLLDKVKYYSLW